MDIGLERVQAVVDDINNDYPGRAAGFVVDLEDQSAVKKLPADVVATFGKIDIIVVR